MREADAVEGAPCPSCGQKTLRYYEDPLGAGGQCGSLDCLEMFELEEILGAKADER